MKIIKQFIIYLIFLFYSSTQIVYAQKELDGPYYVGYQLLEFEDQSRKDLIDQSKNRKISIIVYYPTLNKAKTKDNYIKNKLLIQAMVDQNYLQLNQTEIKKLIDLKRNGLLNAKIKKGHYPLILFSHGVGISKFNYSFLMEDLASNGNIVIGIDHPYGGFTSFENGDLATNKMDQELMKGEHSYYLEIIKQWTYDTQFILNEVLSKNNAFSLFINKDKIIHIGHSLGGNTAIYSSYCDNRIKGAINLDGGLFDQEHPSAYTKNILIMRSQPDYSEEELIAKDRDPKVWIQMGLDIDSSFAKAMSLAKNAFEIKIKGAGHLSFSDTPFIFPETITKFGGNIIEANKAYRIILSAINHFIKNTWSNQPMNFQFLNSLKEVQIKQY